uniref:Uncharacterized protein n=1 Tax=Rhizophora mucronata TaxID=61149 RepID=A0A2P2M460_RHIMU
MRAALNLEARLQCADSRVVSWNFKNLIHQAQSCYRTLTGGKDCNTSSFIVMFIHG